MLRRFALLLVAGSLAAADAPSKPPAVGLAPGDSSSRVTRLEAEASALAPVVLPRFSTNYERCAAGEMSRQECSFRWRSALTQSLRFLTVQQTGNLALDGNMRHSLTHGHWFQHYADSVLGQRFSHWSDDDSIQVDYLGHPMMGGTAGFIFIQNDPRGMDLELSNSRAYWTSRLRATAFAAAYTVQWEIGPVSEASIGNTGSVEYFSNNTHRMTNGTGLVDFVMTPVGGMAWMVAEDAVDKYLLKKWSYRTSNPLLLFSMSVLNPNRSFANLLRFKAPWHRDHRQSHRVPRRDLPFQEWAK